jgi:predicted enzyme related to lactoylglutathione lyase
VQSALHAVSGGSPRPLSPIERTSSARAAGGLVQCSAEPPLWLPYVEVTHIARATELARRLGASVLLEPREGPAGWRSVVKTRSGGEIALW